MSSNGGRKRNRPNDEVDTHLSERQRKFELINTLFDNIEEKVCTRKALDYLTRNAQPCLNGNHKALVCTCCDCFIIGTEKLCWINAESLKKNSKFLSLEYYETMFNRKLPDILRNQYKVDHPLLSDLLLSPRGICKENKRYSICEKCQSALRVRNRKTPPEFAISNGWVVGHIPRKLIERVDSFMKSFVSRNGFFNYIFSYHGGSHKSIKGHHTFFINEPEYIQSVINHISDNGEVQPNVYAMICGKVTPGQRELIKKRCSVDLDVYRELMQFLQQNHPSYKDVEIPNVCPEKVELSGFHSTSYNTENSVDSEVEDTVQSSTYRFSARSDSTVNTAGFSNEKEHVMSVLNQNDTEYTMLMRYGERIQSSNITLEDLLPCTFPFGIGGIDEKRPNNIGRSRCLRHYVRISLPAFREDDFLLIACAMFHQIESFQSTILSCKSSLEKKSVAEALSTITEEQMVSATKHVLDGTSNNDTVVNRLFSSVKASCRARGHSNEAAEVARQKFFSLWHYFGSPSVFLTVSPCDECSFRVRLYANNEEHKMMTIEDMIGDERKCVLDLKVRKEVRMKSPGACALEFESIMQIVLECMIGWDMKERVGKKGIFGIPIAVGNTSEEQMRFTLHAHMEIWIENFNAVRDFLFDEDAAVKTSARETLTDYFKKIATASLGELDINSNHITTSPRRRAICQSPNDMYNSPEDQTIRNMRHHVHCKDHGGIVAIEKSSQETEVQTDSNETTTSSVNEFTTPELIWMNTRNRVRDQSSSLGQKNEQLDCLSYSFAYHMKQSESMLPFNDNVKQRRNNINDIVRKDYKLRFPLLQLRFNYHDHMHRKSCFKKGNECRFELPKQVQPMGIIDFEDDLNELYDWKFIDGTTKKIARYQFLPKRNIGDQFINTCNELLTCILGCNTNVGVADRAGFFYVTMYTSKRNQNEEKRTFLTVCEALSRRIVRIQQDLEENPDEDGDNSTGDFAEGLKRLLSAVYAHTSNDVISSTMAHLLLSQVERFWFSHDFCLILTPHLLAWYRKEELSFRIRRWQCLHQNLITNSIGHKETI